MIKQPIMKQLLMACLFLFAMHASALHVECVGKATLLTNQGDTLLLFASNPEIKTLQSVGNVDWYQLPDTINPVQTGTNYLYPEHGEGYMIKVGSERDVFWVFDYDSLRPQISNIEAELDCKQTVLQLTGEIPVMDYQRINRSSRTYPRTCHINYSDAAWDESAEMWMDSLAVEQTTFTNTIIVGASPIPTGFAISDDLAVQLGLLEDTLYTQVYDPIALKAHPITITTTRGSSNEPSNEVNRPYEKDDIINMSAPLEILFKANGLNADYYQWKIYRGTELMLTRNEAEHRYTFMEKGNYRAVVGVSNVNCALDSVEFNISVSESLLAVPNVFTPNGDGVNDEFRVAYRSIKEFHCWVYNRWGRLVYEWTDPAKGWDGTINGRPAAEGAYFYVIRALGTDAEENAKYTLKPIYTKAIKKQDESMIGVYQLSGSINLLR